LYARGSALFGSFGTPLALALTTTPVVQPTLLTTSANVNPTVFTLDQGLSTITLLLPGFVYNANMQFGVDGAANTQVTAGLYRNGVLVPGIQAGVNLTGAGELHSVNFSVLLGGVVSGDVLEIRYSSNPGATVNFHSALFNAELRPTGQST
jgi:hypothetical protein